MELGPGGAVDSLMDFPDARRRSRARPIVPDLSSIDGYPKNFRRLSHRCWPARRRREAEGTVPAADAGQSRGDDGDGEVVDEAHGYGPYPMQEKLTLFWHGHFTTSAKDERSAMLMWNQNELLRRYAAGNFRDFVRADFARSGDARLPQQHAEPQSTIPTKTMPAN